MKWLDLLTDYPYPSIAKTFIVINNQGKKSGKRSGKKRQGKKAGDALSGFNPGQS
jgi:hypothetical protein